MKHDYNPPTTVLTSDLKVIGKKLQKYGEELYESNSKVNFLVPGTFMVSVQDTNTLETVSVFKVTIERVPASLVV